MLSEDVPLSTRDILSQRNEPPPSESQFEVRSSSSELNEYLRSKLLSSLSDVRLLRLSLVLEFDIFSPLWSASSKTFPKKRCFDM